MQRKRPHKKTGLILFSAVLMLQLSLLPTALSIIQYSGAPASHKVSCSLQHRCTCDTEGADHCPMHNEGDAHHSDAQPYFCGCDHSSHDFIAMGSAGSKAVLEAGILVEPWKQPVIYTKELKKPPIDPYLPVFPPPG